MHVWEASIGWVQTNDNMDSMILVKLAALYHLCGQVQILFATGRESHHALYIYIYVHFPSTKKEGLMIQVSYWNQFISSAEVLPKMLSFIQIPNSSGFTSRQLGGKVRSWIPSSPLCNWAWCCSHRAKLLAGNSLEKARYPMNILVYIVTVHTFPSHLVFLFLAKTTRGFTWLSLRSKSRCLRS